jgi:hypothetical protein
VEVEIINLPVDNIAWPLKNQNFLAKQNKEKITITKNQAQSFPKCDIFKWLQLLKGQNLDPQFSTLN